MKITPDTFGKILYLNSPKNDFLADSFLIGLKEIFGNKVFEFPANKFIYKKENTDTTGMHGIGFTLYNSVKSESCIPYNEEFSLKEFDLIIFGDIYRQSDKYLRWRKELDPKKTIILDGEDTPALWPYYFAPWKKPYSLFYPKPHKRFVYFKREIIPYRTNYYRFYKLLPKFLTGKFSVPENVFPISFSIPESKIALNSMVKTKVFAKHIVDEEVCRNVPGSVTKYAFTNEQDYYNDLQQSKFGITTKRGGWDCLRHYEIAANGAVICFKKLSQKPSECAPHGLVNGINCIEYSDYSDLKNKIENMSEDAYQKMRINSMEWVKKNSCENTVRQVLNLFTDKTKMIL